MNVTNIYAILFLFTCNICIAQDNISDDSKISITQILQRTLQQENKARQTVYTEIDNFGNEVGSIKMDIDSLEVTELVIKNDTLYYTTTHRDGDEDSYYLDQQKVALKDIKLVTKDIEILFEAGFNKVILTRKEFSEDANYLGKITTRDLFRTHILSLRDNEYLAEELISAFKRVGFTIKKGNWFD